MLRIVIPECEMWDEKREEFFYAKSRSLQLEHSLVSLSKWESRWHEPFLSTKMTFEQSIDYLKCMTITQNVPDEAYWGLTDQNWKEIISYIEDPMTATWFSKNTRKSRSRAVITAEVIYYQMAALNIPFECQKWHLNKLFTLIRVANNYNSPSKKMSQNEVIKQYAELNAIRRKQLNTNG